MMAKITNLRALIGSTTMATSGVGEQSHPVVAWFEYRRSKVHSIEKKVMFITSVITRNKEIRLFDTRTYLFLGNHYRYKGLVINYGEGGRNFLTPHPPPHPPSRQGKTCCATTTCMAKTSSSRVKTISKLFMPPTPFSMANTCCTPPPLLPRFVGVNLHLHPTPLSRLIAPPPSP